MVKERLYERQSDGKVDTSFSHLKPTVEIVFAFWYLAALIVESFFSVAFVRQVMAAFEGNAVTMSQALSFALSKWRAILLWCLLSGVVGLVIIKLEERFGFIGKRVVRMIDIAWSVATVFVIPVIVVTDEINPLQNLRSSARAIREAWGELVIGFVGLQLTGVVYFAMLFLCLLMLLLMGGFGVLTSPFLIFVVFLAVVGPSSYVLGIVSDIYESALFVYARTGSVPSMFDPTIVDRSWIVKKPGATRTGAPS